METTDPKEKLDLVRPCKEEENKKKGTWVTHKSLENK
jgi:hypothetical protein